MIIVDLLILALLIGLLVRASTIAERVASLDARLEQLVKGALVSVPPQGPSSEDRSPVARRSDCDLNAGAAAPVRLRCLCPPPGRREASVELHMSAWHALVD
jgi:hypothetical protein